MTTLYARPVEGVHSPYFADFWAAYELSFPLEERRSQNAQVAAFGDARYHLDCWRDTGAFVGFMGWWDFGDYRYIEHVAVAPGARSGGYGTRIMHNWRDADPRPVYLEIEEVVDELTRRRRDFYLRLDFVENPGVHVQPPYQHCTPEPEPTPFPAAVRNPSGQNPPEPEDPQKSAGVRMQVLSWPGQLSKKTHADFINTLHTVVWAHIGS